MALEFTAKPPSGQHPETVRQFQELQAIIDEIRTNSQAQTFAGEIPGIGAIPAAYVPLPMVPALVVDIYRYWWIGVFNILGTAGAGTVQVRATLPNGFQAESIVFPSDSNVTQQLVFAFYMDGPGELLIEIQGTGTDYTSGFYDSHRVGIL